VFVKGQNSTLKDIFVEGNIVKLAKGVINIQKLL